MNIRFLDGLRGIAALIVMIGHARLLLWEGFTSGYKLHEQAYSVIDKALMYSFSIFRYGHEMVILFFILSGFVIHLRFSDRQNRVPINLKTFWYKRFKRLYPPLLFVFLLAFILDNIGKSYGWSIYAQQTPYPNINRDFTSIMDLPTLIGNLLFLMSVYVSPFGTPVVTWSLMYEWWFYMIYPLFYFLAIQFGFRKTTLVIAILFALSFFKNMLVPLLFWKVMDSFIIWWMGACLVEIWRNREGSTARVYTYMPYLVLFLVVGIIGKEKYMEATHLFLNFAYGLGFTGLIAIFLRMNPQHIVIRFLNWLKPLGDCSYTLYLIHVTLFVFVSGSLIAHDGFLPKHHYYVVASIVIIPIISYYLHFLTEKPFTKSKKSVKHTFVSDSLKVSDTSR